MTIEAYTNGRDILFRERTRKTRLPADAPAAYAKSMLGPRALDWCSKRWPWFADRRRVVPLEKK